MRDYPGMRFVLLSDDFARAALAVRAQAFRHEKAKDGDGSPVLHLDQAKRFHELPCRFEEARTATPGT
jgi:hypothetical protein